MGFCDVFAVDLVGSGGVDFLSFVDESFSLPEDLLGFVAVVGFVDPFSGVLPGVT